MGSLDGLIGTFECKKAALFVGNAGVYCVGAMTKMEIVVNARRQPEDGNTRTARRCLHTQRDGPAR